MEWARIMAYITGTVDHELLLRAPGDCDHLFQLIATRRSN
jgi:hypothetical protein